MEETAGRKPLEECYLPDMGGYEDESLKVTIENMREHETNILVARVKIADPSPKAPKTQESAPEVSIPQAELERIAGITEGVLRIMVIRK